MPFSTAGVDWAGGNWLVIHFQEGDYHTTNLEPDFETIWQRYQDLDRIVIDVPIGLPDAETLTQREELDSLARAVTGFSSSVFPVVSREAAKLAANDESFETVNQRNEDDIGKGLTDQSYQLATTTGEVDAILRENNTARKKVIESHPEVCFRGFYSQPLQHKKKSAAGFGERLQALGKYLEEPSILVKKCATDLIGEANSDDVGVDDVLDALALAVVAKAEDDFRFLPSNWDEDSAEIPMRMAYRAEEPLPPYDDG